MVTPLAAPPTPVVALTIAGTDSGGGAGVAADLATFGALGLHGTAVVTAVTAQDTAGVHGIHAVPLEVVALQLDAVLEDLPPAVVKTGMLASAEIALLVAGWCAATPQRPLVVDPVLRATTGASLAGEELVDAYVQHLLPVASVVTPNAAEARVLLGLAREDPTPTGELASLLADKLDGPAVVLTGGPEAALALLDACTSWQPDLASSCTSTEETVDHPATAAPLPSPGLAAGADPATAACTDWLARPGQAPLALQHPAVATTNDHGTGCTHASALAAFLARGDDLASAAAKAAAFVAQQLTTSQQWRLGRGRGPIAHTTTPIPTEENA